MNYKLHNNDCMPVMKGMEIESVHNIITDGIWNIGFLNNKWDTLGSNLEYMEWTRKWAMEAYRILKPGGFLLSFCGTRTYGFMSVGIAQAGFELKDTISHIFGKGMPKGKKINVKRWDGWQTPQLKPSQIFVCVAQKPIEGTYAKNLVKHRVGCFNIKDSKIGEDKISTHVYAGGNHCHRPPQKGVKPVYRDNVGRFPSNLTFDEEAGKTLDEQHAGASRFYYCAKASPKEKHTGMGTDKNDHPTVQSIEFTKYLIKLVCADNTVLLDPFLGSGTTGCAAADTGINLKFIGIEINRKDVNTAKKRIKYWVNKQPVDIFKDAG